MKNLLPFYFLFICAQLFGQGFPKEIDLSSDNRQLLTGSKLPNNFFEQNNVKYIEITFWDPNYLTTLASNYASKTDLVANMKIDGVSYDSVGVRYKGQTSYSMTGTSRKKSFNISLDYKKEDQDIDGYNTLNLNNCFGDPSFMREFYYFTHERNHIPGAKVTYVWLKVNGVEYGLYPCVQNLNKSFIKEWFLSNNGTHWRADKPPGSPGGGGGMWGDSTAALNWLGTDSARYKTHYDLKFTSKVHPWQDLITTCDKLGNTLLPNRTTVIPPVLDVDRSLWHVATENLYSDDDGYIFKGKMDYFAYWESETGRITPLEYDGNSVMEGRNKAWSPFYNATNDNYPLMHRLFVVPEYRQRYLAHLRTLINEDFDITTAHNFIDSIGDKIDSFVNADPIKLSTYTSFTRELDTLKSFISYRRNFLLTNPEVNVESPMISSTTYLVNNIPWAPVTTNDSSLIRTTASHGLGILGINLYYATNIVGNFTKIAMYDDGIHNDGAAGDGTYAAYIPKQLGATWVRFYVEAVANNIPKTVSYDPPGAEHNVYIYYIKPQIASNSSIVINELMASNSVSIADEAGQFEDWIELYNTSSSTVDISNYFISDDTLNYTKFQIPTGTSMPGNSYLILWADEDGSQGPLHTNFKLSASNGEKLFLLNSNREILDNVSFGAQSMDIAYARIPNGTGNFVSQQHTFNRNNETVSINDISSDISYTIYPNPATNKVYMFIDNPLKDEYIYIYDIYGQLISKTNAKNHQEIDVTFIPNGTYLIKYSSKTSKIVIQK
jgi:hypothetical protein